MMIRPTSWPTMFSSEFYDGRFKTRIQIQRKPRYIIYNKVIGYMHIFQCSHGWHAHMRLSDDDIMS